MEEREKQYITKYLPQLSEWTTCDVALLDRLQNYGILSVANRQKLEASGRSEGVKFQAYQLYHFLFHVSDSYNALLSALSDLHQPRAATILSNGKARNFDLRLGDDENDPIVQATLKFISPPDRLRDLLENERVPVLVISTDDITMTTQRIQAEKITHQYHLFSELKAFRQNLDKITPETTLLIAMHGKKRRALEEVLQCIRDNLPISSASGRSHQCIVMTTEGCSTVREVIRDFNSSSKFCDVISDDLKWSQLSREFQSSLLTKLVRFQDQEMTLSDLLSCCSETERQGLLETLETSVLVQLVNDDKPLVCKNTLLQHPTPPFYIPRKILSRSVLVSAEILQEGRSNPDTCFAITGMDRTALVKLKAGGVSKSKDQIRQTSRSAHAQGISTKFVILDNPEDFTALCNKIKPESTPVKNLHWLHSNKDRLEWVRSFGESGCLSLIQEHLLQPAQDKRQEYCVPEQDFITELVKQETGVMNKPAISISDHPGMGKTTLMAHIGQQLLANVKGQSSSKHPRFVQYFVMTDLMRDLEEMGVKEERSLTKAIVLEVLLNQITDTEVVRHLFAKRDTKCDLMLDGFDEVLPYQHRLAVKFISIIRHEFGSKKESSGPTFRLWLTTRPIHLELLERTLGVLGFNMLPFDEQDQSDFLKRYWTQTAGSRNISLDPEKLEIFTKGSIKTMQKAGERWSQFETEMTGLPLQCLLLAQVSEGSVTFECAVEGGEFRVEEEDPDSLAIKNMADLYGRVMDKKLEIFLNRESSNSHLESHLSKNNKQVMKRIHMKLALELLFPDWAQEFEVMFLHEASISPEELSIYGFITQYSAPNQAVWVHRTYAEYFVALFAVEMGTCARLTEGYRVTDSMARFFLEGIMATVPEEVEMRPRDFPVLAQFQMPVVTYFIDELLEMRGMQRMAEEPIPRCLLNSMGNHFGEVAPSGGIVDMSSSKLLACVTNDRMYLGKLLMDSLDENRKQIWLERSEPLHSDMVFVAALRGNREGLEMICELIEELGNQRVSELPYPPGKDPVVTATSVGKVESVEYLVEDKEFKPEVWASPEQEILHKCVQLTDGNSQRDIERRQDIIRFLVASQGTAHETSILEHIEDKLGRTPLLTDEVHIKLRMTLMEVGANVHAYDESGNQELCMLMDFRGITPQLYHEFVQAVEVAVLKSDATPEEWGYIFNSKAANVSTFNLNYTPEWSWDQDSALHLAVGHLEVLDETLDIFNKYAFDWRNEVNGDEYTVVHVAVKFGRSMRLIKKLVELGADWTLPNMEGRSCLHEAAWAGHVEFLQWIFEEYEDFDVNLGDNNQRSPLHYAMRCPEERRQQTVAILLENGADPNLLNHNEETPVTQSLYEEHGISVELLRFLKEKGANILGEDKTEVINAVYSMADVQLDRQWNLGAVVEYLIGEGAQLVGTTGHDKKNLVHRAAGNGWLVGLRLLEKHLEKSALISLATSGDGDGRKPIYTAIKSKSLDVIKWLVGVVGESVTWECCGGGGVRPLHVCVQVGWVEGLELLVDRYRVNLREVDDEGNTALHYAHSTDGMRSTMVEYLEEKVGEGGWGDVRNEREETPQQFGERMMEEMAPYGVL